MDTLLREYTCQSFHIPLFLFVTSVRTTATEWKLNCSK